MVLSERLAREVERSRSLYHRLVLVVGPHRSGKTAGLRSLRTQEGWPLVNVNLQLSSRLIELTTKQRSLRTAGEVGDIVDAVAGDVLLIDNIEMLFHPSLQQDPLRLLQSLSRNRVVVAAWRGALVGNALTYAVPNHPEFRRYENVQALVVSSSSLADGATPTRDHTA
jgi:hypothetical protein